MSHFDKLTEDTASSTMSTGMSSDGLRGVERVVFVTLSFLFKPLWWCLTAICDYGIRDPLGEGPVFGAPHSLLKMSSWLWSECSDVVPLYLLTELCKYPSWKKLWGQEEVCGGWKLNQHLVGCVSGFASVLLTQSYQRYLVSNYKTLWHSRMAATLSLFILVATLDKTGSSSLELYVPNLIYCIFLLFHHYKTTKSLTAVRINSSWVSNWWWFELWLETKV